MEFASINSAERPKNATNLNKVFNAYENTG